MDACDCDGDPVNRTCHLEARRGICSLHLQIPRFFWHPFIATTLATAAADSLVDAGGFANAMIALVGARDTIYQITNQDGVADFRDIPVGRWAVKMIADSLPSAHAVDEDERAVTVRAGERATVGFRVVPKRRAIQLMDPQPPVIARPAPSPPREP